jgi:hypothetical protein
VAVVTDIIKGAYSSAMFTTFLVLVNLACALFMVKRVRQLQKERKEKMWEILNTPANQIW